MNGIIINSKSGRWYESSKEIEKKIKLMNQTIKHRGPDDEGIVIEVRECYKKSAYENYKNILVGLGHIRLSILDLSEAGHQPMFYHPDFGANSKKFNPENIKHSQVCIVFNGEIYNFKEIKEELQSQGFKFTTSTDTEVILASYLKWGTDCVKKFNGMWAFAIYDQRKNIIFASRDRMGKKPFYYRWNGEKFIFSSEIKGILKTGIDRTLNLDEVPRYLLFHYTPAENTLFKNIYKLSAAHNLIFDLKKFNFRVEKYWDIENDEILYSNFELAKQKLDEILNDSVKLRTETSDVSVGTFLSGGLDSSLVSALFKKYYKGDEFHTFNVVWENNLPNESEFAQIVANHIGSKHHNVQVTGKMVLENLEKLQYHYDDPIAEGGYIPNYFVSKYAKQFATVILTGDGGDEAFAGYSYYNFWQKFWKLGQIPGIKCISKILANILPISKYQKGFEFLSNACWRDYDKFIGFTISNFSNKELQTLLTDKIDKQKDYLKVINKTIKNFKSFLNQTQYTDQKILLAECYNIKPDKALMANSLEGRAPLQDYRLVEFTYHIPDNFKIKKGKEKFILKEVAKKYLPKKIFERKKQGYGVPIFKWINTDLKQIVVKTLKDSVMVERGYFNQKQIDFYLEKIHKKYFSTRIWNLFSLELFIRVYDLRIE